MKFALGLEYDGSIYYGWQKQKYVLTIQECLELAISKIADRQVDVVCSGRTDRGVHAMTQIVHFHTDIKRSCSVWLRGLNALLPKDITVLWVQEVPLDFHARFSALSRSYRYLIFNQKHRSSFFIKHCLHVRDMLNIIKIKNSIKYLVGKHDFTSFKSVGCQSSSAIKNIMSLTVRRINNFVVFDITSNSFLYRMVRNIVGCLLAVGLSRCRARGVKTILRNRDIKKKYSTLPAYGLYFMYASYPERYGIFKHYRLFSNSGLFMNIK
ncbi:tRNA pseudouridine(38-40) synthase TruA [Buchnera aphidicola]|uniref:tRNA pseudouridine(38-40) synthase TruA n=1 Tax=Buchnera aphidicola TaxID=9 RepID=UPI00094CFA41|nr:tRNA pseudouridine(38-40) synthase TruA [Buchnera aphidicola]